MGKTDIVLKNCLSDDERFADCYNVAAHGDLMDASKLHVMDRVLDGTLSKNTDKGLQPEQEILTYSKTRDVIRGYGDDAGTICAITCIENQQDIYYGEVAQMMIYDACQYDKQMHDIRREHEKKQDLRGSGWLRGFGPDDRLLPVTTVCVYYGDEPWDAATQLHDIIDFSCFPEAKQEIWKGLVPNYHITVLDVKRMSDEEISGMHSDLRLLFGCLKYSKSKTGFRDFYEQNQKDFACVKNDLSVAMNVMLSMRVKKNIKNMEEEYADKKDVGEEDNVTTVNGEEVVNMCQALEEWLADERAEGRLEGIAEGRAEGIAEGRKEALEMQRNFLLELLRELGNISDSIHNRIMQECDMEQLFYWFKLASRADSLDMFEKGIDKETI